LKLDKEKAGFFHLIKRVNKKLPNQQWLDLVYFQPGVMAKFFYAYKLMILFLKSLPDLQEKHAPITLTLASDALHIFRVNTEPRGLGFHTLSILKPWLFHIVTMEENGNQI
jgi:hypothetical protein